MPGSIFSPHYSLSTLQSPLPTFLLQPLGLKSIVFEILVEAQASGSRATDLETRRFGVQCLLEPASLIWAFLPSHTKPFLALQGRVLSSLVSLTLPETLPFLTHHKALRLSLLSPYTQR